MLNDDKTKERVSKIENKLEVHVKTNEENKMSNEANLSILEKFMEKSKNNFKWDIFTFSTISKVV